VEWRESHSIREDNHLPTGNIGLDTGTIAMYSQQHLGLHYNLHNLYGVTQAKVAVSAMQSLTHRRAFVLTRSSFPGVGQYGEIGCD
jgi:lysosomal alpha-glucosidase